MMRSARFTPTFAASAALALFLCSSAASAQMGSLILDGGGVSNFEIFDRIVAEVPQGQPLCVIDTGTAGSADPRAFFADYVGLQLELFVLDAASAAQRGTAQRLSTCGGFFFNGGNPQALSQAFVGDGAGSPALDAVRTLVAQRQVMFSGSSAGAMIVGPLTLCECSAQSSITALTEGHLFQAPGFGFVQDVLLDAHFFARGLLGRHLFALARNGIRTGVGIDEGTAVIVPRGGGLWEVAGQRAVALIYAPRGASVDRLDGFSFSLLAPGDRFDPTTGQVQVAETRREYPLSGGGEPALFFDAIFAPDRVRTVVEQLVRSGAAEATGIAEAGRLRVTFAKTPRTKAYSDGATFTVLGLRVSIERS